MKKLLAMVLTVSMTAAMVGCGQAAETTETAAESTAVETVEALQQKRPQLRAQKKALQQKKQQAMFYPMQIMLQQIWTAK